MRLSRCVLVALVGALLVVAAPQRQASASDQDFRTIEDSSAQEVVDGMANKLVRGITNVGTGWLELPKQIYLTSKEEGKVKGATVGPVKGIGMALVRTAAGVGEVFTFMLPFPGFYSSYLDPSYVWEKE
ncbi:exosortase system-associated protein, TIGR04073 family [Geomesophilobacter sediminis]|uniref:Exosortase system-associated protein, TIGR04073 family n=1 Tax=Geomesophilobacter sediminis TaxID=2798584 RepID=A0A8J7JF68_9BACT|nr:exosortase system-associated protein, TIGR04073 family [Geomesophilobacter sediminis]MBJ6726066.1 exosortase system-associated protein, TIGR04073 family [Geomesophilobacter sediminis]